MQTPSASSPLHESRQRSAATKTAASMAAEVQHSPTHTRAPLRYRRPVITSSSTGQPPATPGDEPVLHGGPVLQLSTPAGWILDMVSASLASLWSVFFSQPVPGRNCHSAHEAARGGGAPLLRRLGLGVLGAVYVCVVLVSILAVAAVLGIGLVRVWVEEPVSLRQPLHLDYTDPHPSGAVLVSLAAGAGDGPKRKTPPMVPLGHTIRVSLVLLMPESNFNRRIGVFQVAAEVISPDGDIVAKSTQPCMLRFRSLPVRLMRTFMMGIPLLLGISCETQKITVEILKYKESYPRTEVIRVTLKPRSGTYDAPQLYSAEIFLTSRLPWRKELAYNWKWTSYVCVSLYVYVMLLIVLVCCFKPLIFPRHLSYEVSRSMVTGEQVKSSLEEDMEISDELPDARKRWRDGSRGKGKVPPAHSRLQDPAEYSSSSAAGGDGGKVVDDDPGELEDSEFSVCLDDRVVP